MKQLVVNADDFGYTRGVNRGIVAAQRDGIVTATTLMAVASAFADAAALAQANPSLDIGMHAVLTGPGAPLTGARELRLADGCFPRSYPAAIALLATCPPAVIVAELCAQAEKIIAAGIRPTHLDCHKHLHCLPFLWEHFVTVARRYRIPFIRRPGDTVITAQRYPAAMVLVDCGMRLGAELGMARAPHPALRHFAGQRAVGRLGEAGLLAIIAALPDGTTELMVHPGDCDDDLRRSSRLTDSREREQQVLRSPRVRAALAEHGVQLTTFRALAPAGW